MESQGREGVVESVRFGTDGWRAIIAKEFTFDNVGRVAKAVADYLRSEDRAANPIYTDWGATFRAADRGVVVGYDTRFLSDAFAEHVCRVLQDEGIPVSLSDGFIPTPALSYAVADRETAIGIMLTSSHNPAPYNGLKLKAAYGGSAPESITRAVEERLPSSAPDIVSPADRIERVDLRTPFLNRVRELIDRDLLKDAPIEVVIDSMYGSAQGYVAELLDELNIPYIQIRGTRDPLFGGVKPEPLEVNLAPLREAITQGGTRRRIGAVTDGDGDRISGMDERGRFIDAHLTYALILRHLVETRGWKGPIVVSFNLSDLIRRMAKAYGLETIEIPIGFKHAAEHIVKGNVLMAGEESGSLAIRGHIPERDGVLCSLLLAEILASSDKPASELIDDLHATFGPQVYERRDIELETRVELVENLKAAPPESFGGLPVRKVETLDGLKLRFDDGWLLFRASGTEPILRMYCELPTADGVRQMLDAAERVARGDN